MTPATILVVDDEPNNFYVIEAFLAHQGYELHYVEHGEAAIAALPQIQPSLILLDVMMPGLDGIEVCQRIKAEAQWQAVPIIMITALASKQTLAQCLEAGADDFIGKPFNRSELTARVRSMLRISQQYQQLADLNTHLEATVNQRTAELQTLLFQDPLTQLPSRAGLLKIIGQRLDQNQTNFALAYLNCDQFKLINGAFGYTVSDRLLQVIAHRLQSYLGPQDHLARLGQDEFCFLLYPVDEGFDLDGWVRQILDAFVAPFETAECNVFMTACLGIALAQGDYLQPQALLQAADIALYQAKRQGKGKYHIFDQQMHRAVRHRLTLENDLQRALDQQEFVTYYQPIVNLETSQIEGFEALVRWQHPQRGMVSPGEFIPCMEETGLVVRIGLVVLRQACEQLCVWQRQGLNLTMSVNLSVRQFTSPTLLTDIDQVLADTGVNPANLKLEITESAIMQDAEAAIALTQALRSRHIQISIDDFGTGYSSLGYLHRFPIDILKIDRSFVHQIQSGSRNYQVVETIMALSKQLNLSVVAEGIETQAQLQCLQRLGCGFGQGYLFSKPQPPAAITAELFTAQPDSDQSGPSASHPFQDIIDLSSKTRKKYQSVAYGA
ncbi:EAL domain-containing protein [Nodosilinea sp. E11]|uniref:EAL domain-containing response regulator n=1 Tax=Nodosilinea sp. E11 TaxID=3037479 RepID=UPI002934641F|nr:EAL domain-containing protein [Nodosilinea sp. E11]WOD41327.1 EAL domain-containing protein [Nodosilinea sp. E11]